MKLSFANHVVCRTPRLPLNAQVTEYWDLLLSMIAEASPALHAALQQSHPDEMDIHKKHFFSLWKYFSRSKFRATPFGSFGSVSCLPVKNGGAEQIVLAEQVKLSKFRDWSDLDRPNFDRSFDKDHVYVLNSTAYVSGSEIRYLYQEEKISQLRAIPVIPLTSALWDLRGVKLGGKQLQDHLARVSGLEPKNVPGVVADLLHQGLLYTDRHPNITGSDHFKDNGGRYSASTKSYGISCRTVLSGYLDGSKLADLPSALAFLDQHSPVPHLKDLSYLVHKFTSRYGNGAVPLSIVLDPEIGIGYGGLGHLADSSLPQDELKGVGEVTDRTIRYGALERFLLQHMVNGLSEIRLENAPIKSEPPAANIFPNSFAAIVHFCDGRPVLEHAGGCTANSLLGRFTFENEEILKLARDIADRESQANPDVMFFDVAYTSEGTVDNVNRRGHIYNAEFTLHCWSSAGITLHLDDIYLTVIKGEPVLWSAKHQKRLVPRIASAYNYTRSDLAIYRFFCDVQHSSVRSDVSFDLKKIFPGLDSYPRVSFRSVILSPASWRIPVDMAIDGLMNWCAAQRLPRFVMVGPTDQKLVFDLHDNVDQKALIKHCGTLKNENVYLTEALIADDVIDDRRARYAAQYIIPIMHDQRIYEPFRSLSVEPVQVVFPGRQWVYAEIYGQPLGTNDLLVNGIKKIVRQLRPYLINWFFIRYHDPDHHIRLRLQLKDATQWGAVTQQLTDLLNDFNSKGSISDIQIKTYRPENTRYGKARMKDIENLFCLDSRYAISLIGNRLAPPTFFSAVTLDMEEILLSVMPDLTDATSFAERLMKSFATEFNFGKAEIKKINAWYVETDRAAKRSRAGVSSLKRTFLGILGKDTNEGRDNALLADLFHMHINRLFNEDQRFAEALVYQVLFKRLKKRAAMAARSTG